MGQPSKNAKVMLKFGKKVEVVLPSGKKTWFIIRRNFLYFDSHTWDTKDLFAGANKEERHRIMARVYGYAPLSGAHFPCYKDGDIAAANKAAEWVIRKCSKKGLPDLMQILNQC